MSSPVQQLALVETYVEGGVTKVRDSFRLTPSFGAVRCQGFDLGFPEVRASVQDNPQADGTYDETRYTGARSVAITGQVRGNAFGDQPQLGGWDPRIGWNSAAWFTRYLSGWASPARRSRVYFTDDSGLPRFLDVRGDSFSSPIDPESGILRAFQLGLVNPSGKIYSFSTEPGDSADGRHRVLIRQASVDQPGRTYPEPAPYLRNYPPQIGQTTVDYAGTVANGFVANVYAAGAAMQDPRITVTSPDGLTQSIGITGYTIPADTVVTFDTIERTITTSDGVSLDQFKTAPLQWPQLRPGIASGRAAGSNAIGFTITQGSTSAYAEILYFDADLS